MINIADNPSVLQQLAQASVENGAADVMNVDGAPGVADTSGPSAYPSKKLELIDGRYRVQSADE